MKMSMWLSIGRVVDQVFSAVMRSESGQHRLLAPPRSAEDGKMPLDLAGLACRLSRIIGEFHGELPFASVTLATIEIGASALPLTGSHSTKLLVGFVPAEAHPQAIGEAGNAVRSATITGRVSPDVVAIPQDSLPAVEFAPTILDRLRRGTTRSQVAQRRASHP